MTTITPQEARAVWAAIASMETHQKAHAMYLSPEEVAAMPTPNGEKDCPYCGVTLGQMYGANLQGHYICSLEGWRAAGALINRGRS